MFYNYHRGAPHHSRSIARYKTQPSFNLGAHVHCRVVSRTWRLRQPSTFGGERRCGIETTGCLRYMMCFNVVKLRTLAVQLLARAAWYWSITDALRRTAILCNIGQLFPTARFGAPVAVRPIWMQTRKLCIRHCLHIEWLRRTPVRIARGAHIHAPLAERIFCAAPAYDQHRAALHNTHRYKTPSSTLERLTFCVASGCASHQSSRPSCQQLEADSTTAVRKPPLHLFLETS